MLACRKVKTYVENTGDLELTTEVILDAHVDALDLPHELAPGDERPRPPVPFAASRELARPVLDIRGEGVVGLSTYLPSKRLFVCGSPRRFV